MTRRERLEARAERRRKWAESAETESARRLEAARVVADGIPLGQPILVGHHSERRHRRDLERIDSNMRRGVEAGQRANDHTSKAGGIEDALARSIYDDDPDAPDALEARAVELEAERDRRKAINREYRRGDAAALAARGIDLEKMRAKMALIPYEKVPYPPYSLSNLSARIRTARQRVGLIERRAAQTAKADAAPGGVLIEPAGEGSQRLTFPDYPGRAVVVALKAAGYWWARPCWYGKTDALPQLVRDMIQPKAEG